jgi:hypothetical protein
MGRQQKKKPKGKLFERPMENPFNDFDPTQKVPVKTEEPVDLGKPMENPFAFRGERVGEELVPSRLASGGLNMPPKPPRGKQGEGRVVRREGVA